MSAGEEVEISVLTFNVLAPPYKFNRKAKEIDYADKYLGRGRASAEVVLRAGADIVLLQEMWLEDGGVGYMDVWHDVLDGDYEWYTGGRPGKADGVGILIKKSRGWGVEGEMEVLEYGLGDARMAGLVVVEIPERARLVVANTHLSVVKGRASGKTRVGQIKALVSRVDQVCERVESEGDLPLGGVVLGGDLNGMNDAVANYVVSMGFVDSWFSSARDVIVTHRTHDKLFTACDYICTRASDAMYLDPQTSVLLPRDLPPSPWPSYSSWRLSDHRPLFTVLSLSPK